MVNFLQVWIRAHKIADKQGASLFTYNVNKCMNSLVKVSTANPGESSLPFSISLGKFKGRGETTYQIKNTKSGLYVFVIEGAFEVQGTLLHARDGLALWETEEVEMEALSNDAIILLLELPLK
ncbi:MAG: pirin family protein [Chitinophagaceae bacterium]